MDASTGQVLYEADCRDRAFPASTTKILTALVVLSNTQLGDMLIVPEEAKKAGGSRVYLTPGSRMSVEDALYALLLSSANDAAVALAHKVSGGVEAFAKQMNEAARDIGATGSNFTNPHGLPDDNHYTTALDLALVSRAALKVAALARITATQTREITMAGPVNGSQVRKETLTNHNRMLWWYEGCTGMKTGFTQQSLHTMVASAQRGDRELVAVVLGSASATTMWRDAAALLDYGFSSFAPKTLVKEGQTLGQVEVEKGKTKATGSSARSFTILEGEGRPEITLKPTLDSGLKAPVRAGQKIGVLSLYQAGREIGRVDIVAVEDVEKEPSAMPFLYGGAVVAGLALLAVMVAGQSRRRRPRNPHFPGAVRRARRPRPLRPARRQPPMRT
jgi:D-alanyl-D-alanine carboxypeptidase (penicillin-binding protein 5/6)